MLAQQSRAEGDPARAQFVYEQILRALPEEPGALGGLGALAFEAGDPEAAAGYLRRAVAASPADPVLHNNFGIALKQSRELSAASDSFRRAIELKPAYADAHYNLANTLAMLRRFDEAEQEYRRALELAPDDCPSQNNLGTLLELQGRFSEAMACYEAALQLNPNFEEAHRNRAMVWLRWGDFSSAWRDFDRRWRWHMPNMAVAKRAEPRWNGEPLAGRSIVLVAEFGFGDMIHFIRYAALVKQSGARVLLECPAKLHALFQTAPGIDRTVAPGACDEAVDWHCPLASLPAIFHTTLESIPASVPYLFVEPARVADWRQKLADAKGLKIGIVWQGNPGSAGGVDRAIPLERFAPLADCAGVKLFSLQKGHGHEQLPPLIERLKIIDLGSSLDLGDAAFVDTAAVLVNLDLLVTADTSTGHLAGALGVPVWSALPYCANWRWLIDRADSPWYPTMRLFRQPRFGDWAAVFGEMAAQLPSLSSPAGVSYGLVPAPQGERGGDGSPRRVE